MSLRLTTLGGCQLRDEAGQTIAAPYLSLVLLAYLYSSETQVARRSAAQLIWSGNPDAASTNLRSALRRLSQAIGENRAPVIEADGAYLTLNHQALTCDLEFETAEISADNLNLCSDAVAKVFLPMEGRTSAQLSIWVKDVRQRHVAFLRQQFLKAADNPEKIARSDLRRAAVLLLEHDPGDEEIRRRISVTEGQEQQRVAAQPSEAQKFMAPPPSGDLWLVPRIALLPPDTAVSAQKAGSVANALIEDLTIGLCASRAVSVVAPYTSERIRSSRDKAAILERHKITYVLDTQRTEDALFVQLVFLPTDEIIWATRFKLDPGEIAGQRQTITDAVQTSLVRQLHSTQTMALDVSNQPEAYVSFLRGLQDLSHMSLPSIRRARRHFKASLEIDRNFASSLAGLSRTFSMEWILTARGDQELLQQAVRLADQAVSNNDQSAGAFKEVGVSHLFMGRIDESLEALEKAETLSPHYADVLFSHADSLVHASKPADALRKVLSSIELNPLPPDPYFWAAAGACYFLGEFGKALDFIGRMRDSKPADRLAAACWAMLGDTGKARTYRLRVLRNNPDFDLERWVAVLPHKEKWQTEMYREGLIKAGF
ncbi:hypothetical protein [Rhizobium sp. FKY42]|uniref:hypothetical protein n=1 Tax=Rhizobium sp. FKY42 TaxID=2562310 RepID=UPI001FF01137|nr:hypothetical protein [Rhizobium sp. FKY42]